MEKQCLKLEDKYFNFNHHIYIDIYFTYPKSFDK